MPIIPLDLANVEAFDNLPLGKYMGSIDKVELKPATDPTKFDQLQVAYLVIDGELTGRKSSEFLSLSPKAAFRLKRFFNSFGLGDLEGLDIDDETNLLMEPDLVALNVIFEVYEDPKLYQGEKQVRTRLVEVLEDEAPAAAPAPKPAVKAATRKVAAPVAAEEAGDDTEDEDPPEAAPVVAARRPLSAARPAATGPARRTLR